jgi:TolB protein
MIVHLSPLLIPALMLAAAPAEAQVRPTVIAIPPLATPDQSDGDAASVAWQASQLIASDLRSTAETVPVGPNRKDFYSYPEVTAPTFSKWRAQGAKALLTGFVRSRSDGRMTVGCYVYDVDKGRELGRIGFVVAASEWRRAAHKCSGLAYQSLAGAPGMFDTRVTYVAESGPADARVKRIAVMDGDGFNHAYLTAGDTIVLTPRISPKGDRLAFVSFTGGKPHVMVGSISSGQPRPLVPGDAMSFAPRFSPDGRRIVFAMAIGPNSDIYVADAGGGPAQRLTSAPGIDTSPSFSPDGSRIVFESDRSGVEQLYVMNADGSAQRRISFGGALYGSPVWSPDGEWIAFTRRGGGSRIGAIRPDGSEERVLTTGPSDEGPAWAASSREVMFQRTEGGRSSLYRVPLSGGDARKIDTPQGASDPDWSGVLD